MTSGAPSPDAGLRAAERHLCAVEPAFTPVVAAAGPCTIGRRRGQPPSHFEFLARSIAYQQLAGKAAASIWGRVRALVDGRFTPERVAALPERALRAAGLSGSKAAAVHDLAARALDGSLGLSRVARLDDDAVIRKLVVVRGVGEWTAHMFLMFRLGRLDVWPTGDLGVRNGFALVRGLGTPPSARDLTTLGDPFRPYRSVAAWYCWRAVDTLTPGD